MTRLNHTIAVLDLEGNTQDISTDQPLTFRDLVMNALNFQSYQPPLTGDDKTKIFEIATLMFKYSPEVDLTANQIAFIQKMAAQALAALAYGRLMEWSEGKEQFIAGEGLALEDDKPEAEALSPDQNSGCS